jgi:hypothetical protein
MCRVANRPIFIEATADIQRQVAFSVKTVDYIPSIGIFVVRPKGIRSRYNRRIGVAAVDGEIYKIVIYGLTMTSTQDYDGHSRCTRICRLLGRREYIER